MVVLNYTGGEINAKIVYYGPGLSGKTTNLEYIHEKTPAGSKGKMVSMKTQTDRTLFFDFLPLELGEINNYRTRFLLYTVPGQVYYNATRKLVLKGVDALVFVADSSRAKLDENLESLRNLEQNLNEHGLSLDTLPWVIQYNKRDTPDAMAVRDLDSRVNPLRVPTFEAIATKGDGVYETFRGIATMVYRVLKERLERGDLADAGPTTTAEVVSAPAPAPRSPAPAPAAGRAQPQKAPSKSQAAAPRDEGEHEFNSAVDMMLREVDAPALARHASPKTAKRPDAPGKVDAPAPAPARAPQRPVEKTQRVEREPVPASGSDVVQTRAQFEASSADANRTGAEPRTAAPGRTSFSQSLASANREATPADDGLFESIPDSPFDLELGRLPALDEAARASETARDEGPDEFVTDPMRRPSLADTHITTRAEVVAEAAPATAPSEPTPVTVTVPLVLKRSQIRKASAIRLLVDLRITED